MINAPMNNMVVPSFFKMTPRTSELNQKKIRLTDLDTSVASVENDLEYDMRPASSFQFFKNQEIPLFNYDMLENKFPDGQPSQAVWNDYVDFKIKVNDNGDDKVTLTGKWICISNLNHFYSLFEFEEAT